jgi:hypothetical protein
LSFEDSWPKDADLNWAINIVEGAIHAAEQAARAEGRREVLGLVADIECQCMHAEDQCGRCYCIAAIRLLDEGGE